MSETEFSKMSDDNQQAVIDTVTEHAAGAADPDTTAKLLSAANQLIADKEAD